MITSVLSLLLSIQILLSGTAYTAPARIHPAPSAFTRSSQEAPVETRLWWGLIDPEMSTWFARLPMEGSREDERIVWDWSWRGFLAALFGIPAEKEASPDASCA